MLRTLSLILFMLACSWSFGQEAGIHFIDLKYSNSVIIGSKVEINIVKFDRRHPRKNTIEAKISKFDIKERKAIITTKVLKPEQYDEICKALLQIKPMDFFHKDQSNVLDAADIELSFSNLTNTVQYSTYALEGNVDETRKDIKHAIVLILNSVDEHFQGFN